MIKLNFIIDFKVLLGDWSIILDKILHSEYMCSVLNTLHSLYITQRIRPDKVDIFKAFKLTQFKDLKVVILGQDPYPNDMSTGLAFANSEMGRISPSLSKIHKCIEDSLYGGLYIDFDPTLENWAKQGVLLLNTALTVKEGDINSHKNLWAPFTEEVIRIIDTEKDDVVFLLWGNQAKSYKQFIKNSKVLEYHHPSYDARRGKDWECDHFKQLNFIQW